MVMATATADTILARSPSLLTAASGPGGGGAITSAPASATTATCGADFLFPKALDLFYHLDILTVSYQSTLANPTLSCWCGGQDGTAAVQKLSTKNASPFNGSARLQLNFSSNVPCWFELTSESGDCGDVSDTFLVSPNQRPVTGTSPVASISTPSPAPRRTTTSARRQKHLHLRSESPSTAPTATISEPQETREPQRGGDSLSPGAKTGIGIGISLICIAIVSMSVFFFRRRRRGQDPDHLGAIMDHERGKGRKPEKRNAGAPSIGSTRSDEEALFPIQPIPDGYPGSMGYEDVRSIHSITSYSHSHSHSPTNGPHSPTTSHHNTYWAPPQERSIERDELAAARLKSQSNTAIPPVVSYGPNPVTPTLPRPTPRVIELERKISPHSSPDSIAAVPVAPIIPIVPDFPEYPDYTGYSIPPPAPTALPSRPSSIPEQIPQPQPSPPRKTATPNVVTSYGPNRVTPTPLVVSPTVPPDENVINRRYQEHTYQVPVTIAEVSEQNHDRHHERQFSWEALESPLLGPSHMGGLPPYASTTDYEAMEKGAIRSLAEPQEAELPPTKDGYYHDNYETTEYELPGAAPQNAPQLPFQVYQVQQDSGRGGRPGGRTQVVVDEQKVLMSDLFSDADMKLFMEQKAAAKAKRLKEMEEAKARGEEYDLGQPMGQYQATAGWGR
ncbi:hypothetical protein B0T21DRAFT_364512 [Apiosordaria backusii]|uniref:Uncharacterized protein n=1 Tax=Apiosordaria backusii TaxID=314023 RepID=A0AA40BMY5_9PEZI|nr:hypothetical protein B0T21DRAFT_364512 [Apiosordaria backusii]